MRKLIYILPFVLLSACHGGIVEQPDNAAARNDTTAAEKNDTIDAWETAVDTTFTMNGTETN